MATRGSTASVFLFGRSRTISLRLFVVGLLIAISVGLIGQMVPLGAIIVYRSNIAGVFAGVMLLSGAAVIAYVNSGYVVVVLIHTVVLFGLFTSGGVAGYAGVSMIEGLRLMLRFAIAIAILLSTIGYLIGTAIRRALTNQQ